MDISINVERFVWYQLSMFKKNLIYEFEGITEDEFEFFIDMLKKNEIYDFLHDFKISFDDIIPNFVKNRQEINNVLWSVFFS